MQHFNFVNWRIRFLMSRTGYKGQKMGNNYNNKQTMLALVQKFVSGIISFSQTNILQCTSLTLMIISLMKDSKLDDIDVSFSRTLTTVYVY